MRFLIFFLISISFIQNAHCVSIKANQTDLIYPSNIILVIDNKTNQNSSKIKIASPNGNVVFVKAGNVTSYKPTMPGYYTFHYEDSKTSVWVHKKPNVNIDISKIFSPGIVVTMNVTKETHSKNYLYKWVLFKDKIELSTSTDSNFSFTPELVGNYSMLLEVKDNRFPLTSKKSTTNIYRTFQIKNRVKEFITNIPKTLFKKDLPLKLGVFVPLNSAYSVKVFHGNDKEQVIDNLLTQEMFYKHNVDLHIEISKQKVLISKKSLSVHLEDKPLRTGYISIRELPSGNMEILSEGDGALKILDETVVNSILLQTDAYIVLKPIINHPFKVFLMDNDSVLGSKEVNHQIENYNFKFKPVIKTQENITPAFIALEIIELNIPAEKITEVKYFLNGNRIANNDGVHASYSDIVGINTARIEFYLKSGEIVISSKKFQLASTTNPICNLEYDHTQLEVWALCTDTDSFIDTYSYTINELLISKRNALLLPSGYQGESIKFEAVDGFDNKTTWNFKIKEGRILYVQEKK